MIANSRFAPCLYFTSAAFARKVERLAVAAWKPLGLAPGQAYLLLLVLDQPGIAVGQAAVELSLTASTISRFADKLMQEKLITRTQSGKEQLLLATLKAKALMPRLMDCRQAFVNAYSHLPHRDQLPRLLQQMNQVADALQPV